MAFRHQIVFSLGGKSVSKNAARRSKLAHVGTKERHTYTATFTRFGSKHAYRGDDIKTLLLSDVRLNGQIVTDHLWFTCGVTWERLDLQPNDLVQFDARVSQYEKGYKGHREDVFAPVLTDYRLERPTRVRKIEQEDVMP
jgi:hypothetical protein